MQYGVCGMRYAIRTGEVLSLLVLIIFCIGLYANEIGHTPSILETPPLRDGWRSDPRPLGLYNLILAPNPFTPLSEYSDGTSGLRIMFELDSQSYAHVKLTCKVYNLQGSLVKTIAENQTMYIGVYGGDGEKPLFWDGLTNDHRMAQNGRYIVHLTVEDLDGKKEYLKPVVLVR